MDSWTVLIAAHATGAVFALLLGGYLVLRRRKGDRLHRRVGVVWVVAMYWVTLSSFGIQELSPGRFTWIHGLSAWTLVSLTAGVWAALTRRPRVHRGFMVGSYLGLVGAGLASVAFPQRLIPQAVVHRPLVVLAVLVGVALLATLVVRLAGRRRAVLRPAAA